MCLFQYFVLCDSVILTFCVMCSERQAVLSVLQEVPGPEELDGEAALGHGHAASRQWDQHWSQTPRQSGDLELAGFAGDRLRRGVLLEFEPIVFLCNLVLFSVLCFDQNSNFEMSTNHSNVKR